MMEPNVLLVADDHELSVTVAAAARKTGHALRTASSTRNTFEILELALDDVDLAIVDADPSLHSVAILEALNDLDAGLPVIALTEVDEAEAAPILQRHGAAACLKKPFAAEELATLIRKVCACGCRNRPLSCDKWGHVRASGIGNFQHQLTANLTRTTSHVAAG
jgi:two-component system C4-dicarboxylate transport response regulator DctD